MDRKGNLFLPGRILIFTKRQSKFRRRVNPAESLIEREEMVETR